MSIYANAVHGVVCHIEEGTERYFGWPSVVKLGDGTIVAGASGLRGAHVCPWGKSVVFYSKDQGETFGEPQIVHNDMIDNRDLGMAAMGGQKFAITWFSTDSRCYLGNYISPETMPSPELYAAAEAYMATWDDDTAAALVGSWGKITKDGGKTWTRPIRMPVSNAHGFILMKDGLLGYLGKRFREDWSRYHDGDVEFWVSSDEGYTWAYRGTVPGPDEFVMEHGEPHVIELADGGLMGVIRWTGDIRCTFSHDGGRTWTVPERMHVNGVPPHLLRHSSGAIIMTYGYRHPGYGQRAVVSYDEGQTWSEDIIIREDGPNGDLGYPCSIELDDGSIYTVYYQYLDGHNHASLLWSRWELPGK